MTRKIIASGYSYSGSSALFHFLADYKSIAIFPGGEFRMFRASHGLKLLYGEFKQHKRVSPEAIAHFRQFCAGKGVCLSLYDNRANAGVKRLRAYFGDYFDKVVERLTWDISRYDLDKHSFLTAMQAFINDLFDEVARREGVTHVVIDQALRPWMMQYLPCFGDADVFIVRRDIRDQIVDRVNHGQEDDPDFLTEMVQRLSSVNQAISKFSGSAHYRIRHIWFEDFVTNANGCREEILSDLGIDANKTHGERKFQAEKSVRNIGLYKTHKHIAGYLNEKHKGLFYGGGGLSLRHSFDVFLARVSVRARAFYAALDARFVLNGKFKKARPVPKVVFAGCDIDETAQVEKKKTVLHAPVRLGREAVVRNGVEIGTCSYFGDRCFVGSRTTVGAYCSVARDVEIGPSNHPTDFVSTHPFQYSGRKFADYPGYARMVRTHRNDLNREGCVIGNDVWIGAKVVIRRGVKIGTGAIIGAGAVVVKDVPPYAIVGGVPAKIIRYRFDEATIARLLESRWWELKPAELSGVHFGEVHKALDEIAQRRAVIALQNRRELEGEFKNDVAAGRRGVIWFRTKNGYADRDALAGLSRIEILSVNKMKTYKNQITSYRPGIYEVAHASYDPKYDAYKILCKTENGKKFRKPIGAGSLRFRLLWDAVSVEKAA